METIVAGTIIEIIEPYLDVQLPYFSSGTKFPGSSSMPRSCWFFRVSWRWRSHVGFQLARPRPKSLPGKLPLTPFATCIKCSNDIFLQSHEIHVLQCWSKRSKWSPSAALLQTTNGQVAQDDVHLALGFSIKIRIQVSASERPSRLNSRPSSPLRSDKACFHFRPLVQAAILVTNRSPILKIVKAATGWSWLAGSHWTLRLDWRVLHALPCTLTHKHCLQEVGNTYTRVQAWSFLFRLDGNQELQRN